MQRSDSEEWHWEPWEPLLEELDPCWDQEAHLWVRLHTYRHTHQEEESCIYVELCKKKKKIVNANKLSGHPLLLPDRTCSSLSSRRTAGEIGGDAQDPWLTTARCR